MKTIRFLAAFIMLAGLVMTTQDAQADCKSENVQLTINEHGLWLKPDGGPKCMPVTDPSDFRYTIPIRLKTPGSYALRDGQVHVRQAIAKEVNGAPVECNGELEFEESEYTNTGEDDIEVTVVGEGAALGESICYEIVVDDIGMLDPRATVADQFSMMGNLAGELAALVAAYDLLISSSLGDSLGSVSLDRFIEESYDMTAKEADALIEKYRE